jgi:hypothetical protein
MVLAADIDTTSDVIVILPMSPEASQRPLGGRGLESRRSL